MTTALVPTVHRRSALEAFRCPHRYRALYIDGVPDESDPARRGSAFHAAAQIYTQELIRTRQSSDHQLADRALLRGLADTLTPPHLIAEVTELFWRWAEKFELDLDSVLVVEQRQQDAEGHTWQPDRVHAYDALLEIHDYKTHWQPFSEEQAHAEFQSKFYLWQAAKQWPGFQRYRIVFEFVRWGVEVSAEFSPAEIDAFELEVQAVVQGIRTAATRNDWPAQPGAHCSYCTLVCPVADSLDRVPVRLLTRENAERAAALLLVADRARGLLREALSGYCAEHGPVDVGGMEYAHRPTETTRFPAEGVVRVLQEEQIPLEFDVSKTALRKYLTTKRFSFIRADLEALAKVKTGSKFSARRVGATADEAEEE